jgi:DNA-binding IscR family transcriptional regulator
MTASLSNSFAAPISETRAKPNGAYQLHSLDRAISVLEVLRESDEPLSLAEICQRMNLHKQHSASLAYGAGAQCAYRANSGKPLPARTEAV